MRASLGQDLINRLPPELRDRHAQVKYLRDKWVARSANHFDDVRVRIDATLNPDGGSEIHGVSLTAQLAGTFLRDWMIAYRALFVDVRALVQQELSVESSVLSNKVKRMPMEELMLLERVDGVLLTRKSWDPGQNRGRFKSNRRVSAKCGHAALLSQRSAPVLGQKRPATGAKEMTAYSPNSIQRSKPVHQPCRARNNQMVARLDLCFGLCMDEVLVAALDADQGDAVLFADVRLRHRLAVGFAR